MVKRFLRLFPAYRKLEKTIREKDEAVRHSETAVQIRNEAIVNHLKKAESDSNLIKSLNRYIEALEGKAAAQAELIQELKEKLNTLLAMPGNKNEEANNG